MSNDDPKKFLMSGYTGFVPRARGEMGVGYPLLTNKALCEFTNESDRLKRVKDLPVIVERPVIKIVDTKPIYTKDSGQVPHYTGHVPGKVSRACCPFVGLLFQSQLWQSWQSINPAMSNQFHLCLFCRREIQIWHDVWIQHTKCNA